MASSSLSPPENPSPTEERGDENAKITKKNYFVTNLFGMNLAAKIHFDLCRIDCDAEVAWLNKNCPPQLCVCMCVGSFHLKYHLSHSFEYM